ncbi:hypothetical protein [Nocardioides panacisoli]|uniref:Uncharacterized protein n=1 Tax=Nocardioides panacisoli TaxID=627624 RepID=A0ABP7J901_9ACTN
MSSHARQHLTRPRWIWSGLLLAIIGTITAGFGVDNGSWTWSLIGTGLLVLGSAVAIAGGVIYDVHTSAPRGELTAILRGGIRPGVAPGGTGSTPGSRRRAREAERRLDALEKATIQTPRPYPIGPAALAMLLIALFLLVSQWELYPTEFPGQSNANRALACAIVFALCGFRILLGQPGQAHRISAALAGLSGVALLLNGLLAAHDRTAAAGAEAICGAVAVGAALLVAAHQPATNGGDHPGSAESPRQQDMGR